MSEPGDADGARPSVFERVWRRLLQLWQRLSLPFSIAVSLAAIVYAVLAATQAGGLRRLTAAALVPALVLLAVHVLAGGGRYKVAAGTRYRPAVVGFVVAEFANAVSIGGSGGMPMVVVYFARTGMGWGAGASVAALAVLMDGAWNVATLAIAAISDPSLRPIVLGIAGLIAVLYLMRHRVGRFFMALIEGPLQRWQRSLLHEWAQAQQAIRRLGPRDIVAAFALTGLMWTARYAMLNVLISAYRPLQIREQFNLVVRQVVYNGLLLISPTPGGAGTAELAFGGVFGDYLEGTPSQAIWVVWRFLTYYAYLIPGGLAFATVFWPRLALLHRLADQLKSLGAWLKKYLR